MAQISSSPTPEPDGSRGSRSSAGLLTFGIAFALFFAGLALHESLHLVVLHLLGGQGSIIVRPWRFALVDLSLPSLHVQPVPALDFGRHLAVNFFGPALAAVLFAIPLLYVRDRRLRLALGASVAVLIFYAVIESGYLLIDSYLNLEVGCLSHRSSTTECHSPSASQPQSRPLLAAPAPADHRVPPSFGLVEVRPSPDSLSRLGRPAPAARARCT